MSARSGDAVTSDRAPLGQVLRGSVWSLLLRCGLRSIGFVSTIVLARLLTPEDFGIVALASLVVGAMNAIADFGTGLFVIRLAETTRQYCDTAWTVRATQGLAIGAGVCALAPLAADFFDDTRLRDVLFVIALAPALRGFENIGMQLMLRDYQFRRDLVFRLTVKFISTTITIILALALLDYWALVFGIVFAEAATTVGSYLIHPYRPRLSTAKVGELVRFSLSMLSRAIAVFVYGRVDLMLVGRVASAQMVGMYHVAAEFRDMISGEIAAAIGRGAYPALGQAATNQEDFSRVFLQSYSTVLFVCAPSALGLLIVADEFVLTVLGEQWRDTSPILRWLAASALIQAVLSSISGGALIAAGKERLSSTMAWLQLAVRVPLVAIGTAYAGAQGAAATVLISLLVCAPYIAHRICRTLGIPRKALAAVTWRPIASASIMAGSVAAVSQSVFQHYLTAPASLLAVNTSLGLVVYTGCVYFLWVITGRPPGPDAAILRFMATRFTSLCKSIPRILLLLRRHRSRHPN